MEKKQNNNNMFFIIIVALLLFIAVLGFFLGKNIGDNKFQKNPTNNSEKNGTENIKASDLRIIVIDDKRCSNCQTQAIVSQLKQLVTLSNVSFDIKDFGDEGVEKMLKDDGISLLPAIIFSHDDIDPQLKSHLVKLDSGSYSLNVGAKFNPLAKRSDNGFLTLDKKDLEKIKANSHIKGNPEAKVTRVEYSDLECPYCAKLHNNGTPEELEDKYGDDLNIAFNHFPLEFHANALPGAKILECVGELGGTEKFYSLIKTVFSEKKSEKNFIKDEAGKLGVDSKELDKCIDEDRYEEIINTQMNTGSKLFGITGTPGNVLINNETLEYEIISGAYPTENFVAIIDKLLGK